MKYLKEKVEEGVINLSQIRTPNLCQMVREVENERDRDILGHEIMYRKEK